MAAEDMRLLLGSGGYRTEVMQQSWVASLDAFLGATDAFLFFPYALAEHDDYVEKLTSLNFNAGRKVIAAHRESSLLDAIRRAPAIFVGGGNSFRLLKTFYDLGILEAVHDRIQEGVPYIGISAGTNLACPTIQTTNDMPIVWPPSLDALHLIPFQINPHFVSGTLYTERDGDYHAMGGETRETRIKEYHELNDAPVLGLYEGVALCVEEGEAALQGERGARAFFKGTEAVEMDAGAEVGGLLDWDKE